MEPPKENYGPKFYAAPDEPELLDQFVSLSQYGLKIYPLRDGAVAGDASALKMSHAVRFASILRSNPAITYILLGCSQRNYRVDKDHAFRYVSPFEICVK